MVTSVEVHDDGWMTVRDAAVVLGVTAQTVRNMVNNGCPSRGGSRGRGNIMMVRVSDILAWKVREEAGGGDFEDEDGQVYNEARAKAVDWHYRAVKRRADAHVQLGTLIPVDLVADVVQRDYDNIRSNLNSIPGRYAVKLAAASEVHDVRDILSGALAATLTNLSEPSDLIEEAGGDPSASVFDAIELDAIAGDEHQDASDDAQDRSHGEHERRGRRGR